MEEVLNILIIEDNSSDFLLLDRHLRKQYTSVQSVRVDTADGLERALDDGGWGLVLSDFTVPNLNFYDSFARIQARNADLPVILVSGSVGEEQAVELLKLGVWDFVLKGNLTRLVPAVQRALKEKQELLERRHAEEELAAERTLLRTLINTIPDLVWLKDPDGVYLACNPEFERFFGASEAEIVGKTDYDYVDRELADFFRAHDRKAMAAGAPSSNEETVTYTNDGHRALLETIKTPMYDSKNRLVGVLGIARDITSIKQTEQALQESEDRHRTILQTAMDGFWVMDTQGRLLEVNETYCQMSGYSEKELLAMRIPVLVADKTANDIAARIQKIMVQGEDRFESLHRRKDGSIFDVEVSVQYRPIDGGRLVVFLRDITARKRAEEELNRKNAEIEQFIYTVSHDLRSPLVTVKTFMGYLEKDLVEENQEQLAQDIEFIHIAADKMKLMLDELLEMSRIGRVETQPVRVSLKDVLDEALDILAGIISERPLDIRLPDTDLMLIGDRPRLCQVWQNLIENAIKYSCTDGIPLIELGVVPGDGETVFYVRDRGIGIDPQYHGKIFGIFEKLNPKSPGAGMGLSMVQRIVEKSGGRIWVESEGKDTGACFFFTLPLALLPG